MYHINHADFQNLGILKVNTRAEQLRLNHVFNIFQDVCPKHEGEFLSDYQFDIHIIRGVVILIPKIKTPIIVLVLFTTMLSEIGIVCLITLNPFH